MRSRFMVTIAVRRPRRAEARAASQPACPAPITITSYFFCMKKEDLEWRPNLNSSEEVLPLKILILGGGGREHALAWRLSKSSSVSQLFASPGNPGIEQLATCFPAPNDVSGYTGMAERLEVDLTVVGPEAPLVAGIVDQFRARGLKVVGPTQAAARLEGSKIFAKQFFSRAGIPTARAMQAENAASALEAVNKFSLPVVIKADGLAAGKGVVIATTHDEASDAIRKLGPNLVIEEFLDGEEVSFIGLSNGEEILSFAPTQDHKRIFDNDEGPNTGGMGAYCDTRILTPKQADEIVDRIMQPAIWQMKQGGTPFTGFLYAGLMMTADGAKVLEFNVRLGDPETQALMYAFDGDLAGTLDSSVNESELVSQPGWVTPTVCVVMSAAGYPDKARVGDEISGIEAAEKSGSKVFHAGTRREGQSLLTNGGRVLGVTAEGTTLQTAIDEAYRAVHQIRFDGMHYRKDIARKGLRRW